MQSKKTYRIRFLIISLILLFPAGISMMENAKGTELNFPFDLKEYTSVTPNTNLVFCPEKVCECSASSNEIIDLISWKDIYLELKNGCDNASLFPDLETVVVPASQYYLNNNIIPIAVINAKYLTIKESAFTDNFVSFNPDNPFISQSATAQQILEELSVFTASVFVESKSTGTFQFKVPSNLIFSNLENKPVSYDIDFGDGSGYHNLDPDELISITYTTAGIKTIKIKGNFGTLKATQSIEVQTTLKTTIQTVPAADYSATITSTITDFSYTNTGHFDDSGNKYGKAEIKIWCAEGKNDGLKSFDKPLIIADGFDPSDGDSPLDQARNCDDLYMMAQEWNSTVDLLQEKCYDIVAVNWVRGADYIQKNAFALIEVLKFINSNKVGCNEIVYIGPSMGGLIGRYALTYMENHNMEHNVGFFISDDSPHRGANIPLALQKCMEFFSDMPADNIKQSYRQLTSPASRQLLVYYFGTSQNVLRTNLVNELTSLGNYPQKSFNIAIASGSGIGKQHYNSGGSPFNPGIPFFYTNSDVVGNPVAEAILRSVGNNTNVHILQAKKIKVKWKFNPLCLCKAPFLELTTTDLQVSGTLPYDNCPGGYYPNYDRLISDDGKWWTGGVSILYYPFFTFIPTISAIDLDHSINDLFYANATESQTPFDKIVYTKRPAMNGGAYEMPPYQYAWNEKHCFITKDKQDELFPVMGNGYPDDIKIQNRTFISPSGYSYSVQSNNSILAGSNVDPGKTAGQVIVYGDYKFTATNSIIFKEGFKVAVGAKFISRLSSPVFDCGYAKNAPLIDDLGESNEDGSDFLFEELSTTQDANARALDILLYPNPTQGLVFLSVPGTDKYLLEVFNSNGALVLSEVIYEKDHEIDMSSYARGLYIVKIQSVEVVQLKKFLLE